MTQEKSPPVIVSIHDTTPFYEKELETIMHHFSTIKKSFLITPDWHHNNPITPSFASLFKGEETILHGLAHTGTSSDKISNLFFMNKKISRELKGLDKAETTRLISEGVALFEEHFGKKPDGFIPPMWYHNKYSMETLKELGFRYTEGLSSVVDLKHDKSYFNLPISFDFGNNKLMTDLSFSLAKTCVSTRKFSFLRFAIHPMDIRRGHLERIDTLLQHILSKGYVCTTYDEFLN